MELYQEKEVKVLDIDTRNLGKRLEELGAVKVYEGERTITTFDTPNLGYRKEDKLIRMTEEGTVKVSIHTNNSKRGSEKKVIKYKVSRAREQQDFFLEIGLIPITKVKALRISYEWNGIDFDIDQFPGIPAFLEIDLENTWLSLEELLEKLELTGKDIVDLGTESIFARYGIDYYNKFKIEEKK